MRGGGGLQRRVDDEAVGARFGQRQQRRGVLAGAGHAHGVVVVGGGGDEAGGLRVREQLRGHADRAAGIEHVDHRAVVGRIDPERGVDFAGRRSADQQRHGEAGALHFLGHRHHLVQRGGDEAREADDVHLLGLRGLDDPRPRHHHAHVDHLVAVALEHHADDVLADVVNVALHSRHDDPALGL